VLEPLKPHSTRADLMASAKRSEVNNSLCALQCCCLPSRRQTRRQLFFQLHCCDKKTVCFQLLGEARAQQLRRPGLPAELQELCIPLGAPSSPHQVGQELTGHTSLPKLGRLGLGSCQLHPLSGASL